MLREPTDVEVGQTCYLYPQSKQASANVHKMLTVKVLKDPAQHWPMVVVGWGDQWELVHRDNIRLRSPAARNKKEEAEGDTVTASSSRSAKVKRMPGRAVGYNEEQGTLW